MPTECSRTALCTLPVGDGDREDAQRALAKAILDVEAYGRNFDTFLKGPGFVKGHKRFLPPGSPMTLFWEYLAYVKTRSEDASLGCRRQSSQRSEPFREARTFRTTACGGTCRKSTGCCTCVQQPVDFLNVPTARSRAECPCLSEGFGPLTRLSAEREP